VELQVQTLTRISEVGRSDFETIEHEKPKTGLLLALLAVFVAVVALAGLPVAAGLAVLLGVPARTTFALELLFAVVVCGAALVVAWRVGAGRS
jgi:hypothetical protein